MEITRDFINNRLNSHTIPVSSGLHGYIIIVDNDKIWNNGMGVFLFPTRKQAVTSFYNTMNWKVVVNYRRQYNERCNATISSYRINNMAWKAFKQAINFKCIRI